MAVNIHVSMKPLEGESLVKGHEKHIEVISWGWAMTQSGTTHSGTGGGSGKVNVQDVSFVKYVDKASTGLMKFCCSGNPIKEIKLTVRKAGTHAASLAYVELTMSNCIITSVTTGGSGDSDRLTETVTVNFSKFEYKYTPQGGDHSAGASDPVKWDIAANCEA